MSKTERSNDVLAEDRSIGMVGDPVVIVDAGDTIVAASPSAELLLGAAGAPARLAGRSLADFLPQAPSTDGARVQITVEVLASLSLPSVTGPARVLRLRQGGVTQSDAAERADTVAVLAHEVKTPLTAIIGSLTLVDADTVGTVSEKVKPLIEMALRNARRAQTMINGVLDVEMIPTGGMALEPVDLAEVVRRAVEAFGGVGTARNVDIHLRAVDGPVPVLGNAERLERATENLISNAAKFSDPGGTVDVGVGCDSGWARVTVADTGPGIPAAFQPKVFEKFAKHDAEDGRNSNGSGLGLSIARAIVAAHSGRIGFSSKPGDTRFWIDIPLDAASEAQT